MHSAAQQQLRDTSSQAIAQAVAPSRLPKWTRRTFRAVATVTSPVTDVITLLGEITGPFTILNIVPWTAFSANNGNYSDVLISNDDRTDTGATMRDQRASFSPSTAAGFNAHDRAKITSINLPVHRPRCFLKISNHCPATLSAQFSTTITIERM